jgi:prolyl-tRNA editing enzyme YbaK/EbsC (Cys-tRNA(Pro) deacylase)
VERTILELPVLHINGGKRGFLVTIAPKDLQRAVEVIPVDVAVPRTH